MESALCLHHGLLPTLPQGLLSSGSTARAITKPLRIRPLSLSNVSTHSNVKNISPVICAVDRLWRPSKNENGDASYMGRGTVGASLLLASVIVVFGCSCKMTPKAIAARNFKDTDIMQTAENEQRMSIITPKTALRSLILEWYKPTSMHNRILSRMANPRNRNPNEIRSQAIARMQSTNDAVKVHEKLEEALKNFMDDKDSQHILRITLLEALIRQENYEAAIKYCDSINDEFSNSDTRIILCKAIIYSMSAESRHQDKAVEMWKKFIKAFYTSADPSMFD